MAELEDCIGKLTGYRCPECGCCLYINNMDNVWCSNCSFRTIQQDTPLRTLSFVPVPENHPHIELFHDLQIINEPMTEAAELRVENARLRQERDEARGLLAIVARLYTTDEDGYDVIKHASDCGCFIPSAGYTCDCGMVDLRRTSGE